MLIGALNICLIQYLINEFKFWSDNQRVYDSKNRLKTEFIIYLYLL